MRILLDPSCSGSGTTFSKADPAELAVFVANQEANPNPNRRPNPHPNPNPDPHPKPNPNQEALLRHALSFPSVLRVVYSTCRLGLGLGIGLANPNPNPNPDPDPNPNPSQASYGDEKGAGLLDDDED